MGHKRKNEEALEKLRKKPAAPLTYNLRGAIKNLTQADKDFEKEDIRRRLSVLRLQLSKLRLSQVSFPITRGLSEFVQKIGNEQYEFHIPFQKLPKFNRLSWGVKDKAKSLLVRLEFLCHEDSNYVGFCIHFPPGDRESEYQHNYCTTDGPWKDFVFCNTEPNFLTDTLSRKLHKFLGQGKQSLTAQKIYDKIVEVASSDPTVECLICGQSLGSCREEFENFPLTTRLSPFLQDPAVLDFLLCCLGSSTWADLSMRAPLDPRSRMRLETNLAPTCPIEKDQLHNVLNSFPAISAETTVSKLLEPGEFRSEREALLNWLSSEFDGTLITAPETAHIYTMPGARQFILLNTNIKRQTAFEKELERSHIRSGPPGFHGTPPENIFNILREGLKRSESLATVFFSDEPRYSAPFIFKRMPSHRCQLRSWSNSAIRDSVVMFGVEIAHDHLKFDVYEADVHEDKVMVRYVFILPSSPYGDRNSSIDTFQRRVILPEGSDVLPSMEKTYRQIKSGLLISTMEKQAQDI